MEETTVNETSETTTDEVSFGMELAKAFAISAASVAGSFAGIALLGAAYNKIVDVKESRKARKLIKETTEEPKED